MTCAITNKTPHRVWEMWSCDSSTIRLGAMPKPLDVHNLHMNTHKLSCQHPTQIRDTPRHPHSPTKLQMVQAPHHCSSRAMRMFHASASWMLTRRRRDWSDTQRGSCRGALPTRTSPLFAASLVTQLALNASRTPLGLESRGLT